MPVPRSRFRCYLHYVGASWSGSSPPPPIRISHDMSVGVALLIGVSTWRLGSGSGRIHSLYVSRSRSACSSASSIIPRTKRVNASLVDHCGDLYVHEDQTISNALHLLENKQPHESLKCLLREFNSSADDSPLRKANVSAALAHIYDRIGRSKSALDMLLQGCYQGRPLCTLLLLRLARSSHDPRKQLYQERDDILASVSSEYVSLPAYVQRELNLVGGLLGNTECLQRLIDGAHDRDPDALLVLARGQTERGRHNLAVQLVLKAMLVNNELKQQQQQQMMMMVDLGETLLYCVSAAKHANGGDVVSVVIEALDETKNPLAYSYVASTLKHNGDVRSSIELNKYALQLCRLEPVFAKEALGLCLSVCHSLEALFEYEAAISELIEFLKWSQPQHSLERLDLAAFIALFEGVNFGDRSHRHDRDETPALLDAGACQVLPGFVLNDSIPCSASEPDLDVLALLFTATKIAFISGALTVVPALVRLLEPPRTALQNLHRTRIRNEHAYYTTVAQLMRALPPSVVSPSANRRLVVVGDSHCLSSAWTTVQFESLTLQIEPRLITGMKCWHMRDEGRFYTKTSLNAALSELRRSDVVMFNFGEIDCREGMLVAVEKARYGCLADAISHTIDIYIAMINELIERVGFHRVLVHPVVPVLALTRSTVMRFNEALQRKLRTHAKLVFLPVHKQLLDKDGQLCSKFTLDGTHLHSRYVHDILEPAIQEAIHSS